MLLCGVCAVGKVDGTASRLVERYTRRGTVEDVTQATHGLVCCLHLLVFHCLRVRRLLEPMTVGRRWYTTLALMRLSHTTSPAREASDSRLRVALRERVQLGQVPLNLQLLVELNMHLALTFDCLFALLALDELLNVHRGALLLVMISLGSNH